VVTESVVPSPLGPAAETDTGQLTLGGPSFELFYENDYLMLDTGADVLDASSPPGRAVLDAAPDSASDAHHALRYELAFMRTKPA
jgi:hypothetical protein